MPGVKRLALVIAVLAALAGCSAPVTPATPAPAAAPVTVATPTPAKTARGTIPKTVGQDAGAVSNDGARYVTFRVTGIRPAKCASYAQAPASGNRFLLVDMEIATFADPTNQLPLFEVTTGWEFVDDQGLSTQAATSAALNCGAAEVPSQQFGPNRQYKVTATVEVPEKVGGALILQQTWEWRIDAA